jgi:hypothetical protein
VVTVVGSAPAAIALDDLRDRRVAPRSCLSRERLHMTAAPGYEIQRMVEMTWRSNVSESPVLPDQQAQPAILVEGHSHPGRLVDRRAGRAATSGSPERVVTVAKTSQSRSDSLSDKLTGSAFHCARRRERLASVGSE